MKKMSKTLIAKRFAAIIGLTVMLWASVALAQGNNACITCHAEKSLTKEDRGRIRSLFVDGRGFEKSTHGALAQVEEKYEITEG